MLSNTLEKALNEHIQQEFYSSYLYLAMASYCESINLGGFAHWLQAQSQEEWAHGKKFFEHIQHRGGRVRLQALDQPPSDFGSPLEMFQQVLEHERQVTAMIHKLYEQALKENDYPAQVMLQWFVSEQVEEEKSAHDIIEQLKLIGDQGTALLMLDRQLGARE